MNEQETRTFAKPEQTMKNHRKTRPAFSRSLVMGVALALGTLFVGAGCDDLSLIHI